MTRAILLSAASLFTLCAANPALAQAWVQASIRF
jgi:hypothetical protein